MPTSNCNVKIIGNMTKCLKSYNLQNTKIEIYFK